MKRLIKLYLFLLLTAAAVLTGCTADDPVSTPKAPLAFRADISDPGGIPPTRATIATNSDDWSYVRFNSTTDTIGFYSIQGNLDAEGGNGPFINEPMVYTGTEGPVSNKWYGLFSGINMDYDVGLIQGQNSKTFVYFPYATGMEEKGLKLRREAADGSIRCVDALSVSKINENTNAVMGGTFVHNFAEIMITRGEGFDSPPDGKEGIKVVLNKGYSHVKVVDNPYFSTSHPNWKILLPVYNDDCGMTEQECREWTAWRGADYQATAGSEPIPAYYVIVPTAISSGRSTVDYIEICDNLGNWHKITSFYLYTENDKRVDVSARYPLEIMMEDLVPTVYPFTIQPWDDVTNVTDQRNSGISSVSDFSDFIMQYNRYIESGRTVEGDLSRYGDRWDTDGTVGWHFYLNGDIDMSEIPEANYRIPQLCDTIDGLRNAITNLKIKDNSGFIGQLQEGGCLRNLDIRGLSVTNSSDSPTGGLVTSIFGGLITNCNVDGYVNTPGVAGMAAAEMSGGIISSCSFSGLLVGKSTFNRLFGTEPTGGTWQTGNSFSGIIFTQSD